MFVHIEISDSEIFNARGDKAEKVFSEEKHLRSCSFMETQSIFLFYRTNFECLLLNFID